MAFAGAYLPWVIVPWVITDGTWLPGDQTLFFHILRKKAYLL